ncbi:putative ABC transporter ATP-binding protein [Methanobrevibacter oralis]|uniref:ABC transporter ATP-binding protein n=1 Tax=Methanobrevibacter oralis TaxID=66851 RepID=A0A165ZBW6_METOA|nr:ABC transporter ATP-binding protein [Methanobrevibacter oralis]KZX10511.1 putative ABC transporter ATP-binding protein [Methanobrevibacter oralis]
MFKDLLLLAGKRRNKLIFASFLHFLSSGMSIVPFFMIYLIILIFFQDSIDFYYLALILITIPIVYALEFFVMMFAYNISHRAAYEIIYEVRIELANHLITLPLSNFQEKHTGDFETVLNENSEILELFLAHHLPEMISTIFVPFFTALFLFYIDWRMALICLIPIILAFIPILSQLKSLNDMINNHLKAQSYLNSTILEYVMGIKVIKVFNRSKDSFDKYKNAALKWNISMKNWSTQRALPFTLYQAFIGSTLLFIIPSGFYFYINGTLTIESFILFMIIGPIFGNQFMRIYEFIRYNMEERESLNRINQVLSLQSIEDNDKSIILDDINYIEFQNLSFSYDNQIKVLKNLNILFVEGKKYALVGPSGSGKTTITRLILRFWDDYEGKIKINNIDIKEIPLKKLLSFISIVFQNNFLFNDTVFENIRIGNPNASLEDVIKVSKETFCHEFIENLPKGYDTVVGEGGTKLSNGEKQRIAIARAILKDAPLIILDEFTGFIDAENEYLIQKALDRLTKNKTVIIIAHKLSTIKNVDHIFVLNNGEIVEEGNHETLMDLNDYYKKLWDIHSSTDKWKVK